MVLIDTTDTFLHTLSTLEVYRRLCWFRSLENDGKPRWENGAFLLA